jgi:hypothetical protein
MEAASLRAMRDAITATQAFEMQNKELRVPRIGGKLVLRLCAPAHVR